MKDYDKCLDMILEAIYYDAGQAGLTFHALARRAGLSPSTVYRIAHYDTRLPRLKTIMSLARAVGMSLVLKEVP